jgi:outer membrane protein
MKGILTSIAVIFSIVAVHGQSSSDTSQVLTFEEAVKIGLMNSVTLNQQRNNLQLTQMAKTSSLASLGPSVSLNGNARRLDGNSFDQQQGRAVNGIRDNVSVSLDAEITLFQGFNNLYTLKQNAKLVDAQAYFVKRTSQDVINTVSNQYLQVLLDVELLRIAKENFEVQNQQLQQTHEFVVAGSRAPVDELNQDALTKAAELTMVQAEITLNNDKALLTQSLLADPFDEFEVVKPGWDINTMNDVNLAPDYMLQTAKLNRADYLQAERTESARKYGMRASQGNMMPRVYAFGSYGTAYNYIYGIPDSVRQQNEGINRPWKDQFRTDNVYKVYGLGITIPLFNGFQNRAGYVQQRVNYENSQLLTKSLEVQLKTDIQRARRNFEGAQKAFLVSQAQLKSAEEAYRLETERSNLGLTNLIEYSTANRAFVQAQTNFAQAEYRLLFQKIQLDYALGTLKIENFQ